MKHKSLTQIIFFIIFLLPINAFAGESTVTYSSTLVLVDVWGSSGSDVFAVGDYGTILHYDGNNWSSMTSGTTSSLNGVWGSSDTNVFVLGGTASEGRNISVYQGSIGNKSLAFNSDMSVLSLEHTSYASDWEEIVGGSGSGYVKKIDNTSDVTGVILVVPGDSFSSDGIYTLSWDDSEDTLTWGSGSAVTIDTTRTTALTYYLDDGSGGYVAASVESAELPVGDASDSITVSTVAATNGFSLGAGNESLIDFIEYKEYLYAGIEGYPGGEAVGVYRSKDGITWSRIIDQAFWGGATNQDHVDTFMIFNGYLYFSTGLTSGTESGTQVWKSSDGISWQNCATGGFGDSHNENGQPGVVFDNYLYFSTFNSTDGTQIWRTNDGTNWSQSGTNGLGYGLTWIDQFIVYKNNLYAFRKPGSSFPNSADGQSGLVFRTEDGENWSMIKQFPPNQRIFKAIVYNEYIYGFYRDMSLTNWQVMKSDDGINWEMVCYDTGIARTHRLHEIYEYNEKLYLISETDGIIWASSNGADWGQINTTDFGDTDNNAFYSVLNFKGNLYVGFFDNSVAGGLEIWRWVDVISDADTDGIDDNLDNCLNKPNGPELGTCSASSDKPDINCTSDTDCAEGCSSNGECLKNQKDSDNDGVGDVCDYCYGNGAQDSDADGHCDLEDNCPTICNVQQLDADSDGIGDVCDTDPGCGGCGLPQCENQC